MRIEVDDPKESKRNYIFNNHTPNRKVINMSLSEEELDMLANKCGPNIQVVVIGGEEYAINFSGIPYDEDENEEDEDEDND